jgi:hypothetical protein
MYQQHPELGNRRSHSAQRMFQRHGFECLIPGYELADYLDPSIFPGYYQTRPRLLLEDHSACFPDPHQNRPLLVHAPSDKARKGTEAVLAAVATLRKTHSFDFKLIHQMPRDKALETVAAADLFLDQFTIGAEGLAALEAMALGKPVVCFIKESLRSRYPAGFPIVVADQDTLAETIAPLVQNARRRNELGVQSRKYVEEYHDARKLAAELFEIYEHLSSRDKEGRAVAPSPACRHWRSVRSEREGAEACVQ